ncbi:uncharacterized protein LOC126655098 [Mercurialis annua]|uniref:uncharacterized protein LOC126655098 n=1 Tax=Mercurialis annua TaxID=3986 RepID=UPI002160CFDA|nr:uncharacterized protein LOC126655098 [Mercurialis annua]
MAKFTVLFSSCSLVMAVIFAYSASVQLNDPDWYFWFPLYACACLVNLVNWRISSETLIIRKIAKVTLWFGIILFLKVVIEDFAEFWLLDVSERVVREKIGSGLVIISLILQLEASHSKQFMARREKEYARYVNYGMAMLVIFSIGLPFVFFLVKKGEMKFD